MSKKFLGIFTVYEHRSVVDNILLVAFQVGTLCLGALSVYATAKANLPQNNNFDSTEQNEFYFDNKHYDDDGFISFDENSSANFGVSSESTTNMLGNDYENFSTI